MKKKNRQGFDYFLSKEVIKRYQAKPPEMRLAWLYMGNLLRMQYPENIIKLHNRFREGKI